MIVAVVVVAFAGFTNSAKASDCTFTRSMYYGVSGTDVGCLQTALGVSPASNWFGNLTKAAVMAWQASHGVPATGYFGDMSRAAWTGGMPSTSYPAGCTSSSGYSTTTGMSCASSGLPAGCTSTTGYSPTTGASCSGSSSSSSTLSGGAGTLDYSATTAGLEDTIKEGATEKVLAFKAEADGSDIAVTSLKVELQNDGYAAPSSEKLTNYVDSVSVWMGDKKVGSADASDFSRNSGTPDEFTKTISLSNAIIKDGVKATFYVALTAVDTIDTDNMDADWTVDAQDIRFNDATGAIISDDLSGDYSQTLTNGFEDASSDDDVNIKTWSTNPAASTFQVKTSDTSDEVLVGAFKFDVGDNSSDVTFDEIPVYIEVGVNATDNSSVSDAVDYASVENIIDSVKVKIGDTMYDADLADNDAGTHTDFNGATGSAEYIVTVDDGTTVSAGEDLEAKVYMTFNDQDTHYDSGTTIVASVVGADMTVEGADNEFNPDGSFTSKTHTLAVASLNIAKYSATQVYSPTDQTAIAKYTLVLNVTNDSEDDLYLPFGAIANSNATAPGPVVAGDDAEGLSFVLEDSSGVAYATADDDMSIAVEADDADIEGTSAFLIANGTTEKITLTVTVDNTGHTAGSYRLRVTGAISGTDDADGTDAGATNVAQSFSTVRTNTLALTV